MVRTRTRTPGKRLRISRVACTPSITGILRSISTTSGRGRRNALEGLGAVAREAHHLDLRRGAEDRAQSLADDLLIVADEDAYHRSGIVRRTALPFPGALSSLEHRADHTRALAHAVEAEAAFVERRRRVEAAAVVGDEQRPSLQPDRHAARMRVAHHVGERLGRDAVDGVFHLAVSVFYFINS